VAYELAKSYTRVCATDISNSQLKFALEAENIDYSVQPAEQTNFDDHTFDLITVAQAIHWFDFEKFHREVYRTAKLDSIICVIGYGLLSISPEIDKVINKYYKHVIGAYWDPERKYIDEKYATIPFPYEEIDAPAFLYKQQWTLAHLLGYFETWSATKHYITMHKHNPVDDIRSEITLSWRDEEFRQVNFPILLRAGRIKSRPVTHIS